MATITPAERKNYPITGGVSIYQLAPKYIQLGDPSAGEFNVELAKDTDRVVREKYGNHPFLPARIGKNGTLLGSNSFTLFTYGPEAEKLHGQGLRHIDYKTLKAIVEQSKSDTSLKKMLSTFYDDGGLVASEAKGPNEKYKQHLLSQLNERGVQLSFPIVFDRLKVEKDDDFPGGLRFDLADEESVAYHDPAIQQFGGLGRLCRNWVLYLSADNVDLPGSNVAGRVSFVKGAAPQNFGLEMRIQKAINVLMGR